MTKKKKLTFILDDQITLSPKTIQVIEHLIEYKQEALKHFLIKIVQDNLTMSPSLDLESEESQTAALRLILLFNAIVEEIDQELDTSDFLQRTMIPSLKHISCKEFENTIVRSSAKKAVNQAKAHHKNLKKILCSELLKHWKPSKKTKQH